MVSTLASKWAVAVAEKRKEGRKKGSGEPYAGAVLGVAPPVDMLAE